MLANRAIVPLGKKIKRESVVFALFPYFFLYIFPEMDFNEKGMKSLVCSPLLQLQNIDCRMCR